MSDIAVNIASLSQSCENNRKNTIKLAEQRELLEKVADDLSRKWEGIASNSYFGRFSVKQDTLATVINGMQDVVNYEHKAVQITEMQTHCQRSDRRDVLTVSGSCHQERIIMAENTNTIWNLMISRNLFIRPRGRSMRSFHHHEHL